MTEHEKNHDKSHEKNAQPPPPTDLQQIERELKRVAYMFAPHKDDPLMRELCRVAIKCVQERWIGV